MIRSRRQADEADETGEAVGGGEAAAPTEEDMIAMAKALSLD